MGITDARHSGIHVAVGEVVVLLDSHIEVSEAWLQPLLSVLEDRPRAVALPLVQVDIKIKSDLV